MTSRVPALRVAWLAAALLALVGCATEAPSRHGPRQSPGSALVEQLRIAPLQLAVPRVGREVERRVLPNGIILYMAEDRSLPVLDAYALFRAGSLYEPAARPGVAQFTASQLRNGGTARLSPEALNEALEVLGASVESSTGTESISFHLGALARNADEALRLFAEMIRQPAFDPVPLDVSKGRVVEELRRVADSPPRLLAREFARTMYTGEHPLGRPLTPGQVAAIQRPDLLEHSRRLVRPGSLMLAVVGDFSRAELAAKIEALFGDWAAAGPLDLPPIPPVQPRFERSVYILPRPLPQASLILGHFGINRFNPDRYAVELMDFILGGSGFSSRIMQRVRTEEGLAYSVTASFPTASRDLGLYRAMLQTRNENVPRAVAAVLEEMARLQEQPVAPEELERAKEAIINSFVFRFPSRFQSVVQLLRLEFDGYPSDHYETLLDRYRAVTVADIQRVARQYLHPDATTIMIIGDPTKFESVLAPFGPIHRLSVDPPG